MPNVSALQAAMSGMYVASRRIDVAGHNIANVNTPGHQRQALQQLPAGFNTVPALWSTQTVSTGGVVVTGVTRTVSEVLIDRASTLFADAAFQQESSTQLRRIEGVFPEPGDLALGGQLSQFWSSWQEVATFPQSSAARTALLEQTSSLVSAFHRTSADLTRLEVDAVAQMSAVAVDVNGLTEQVIGITHAIRSSDPRSSITADLLSQRDRLGQQLAELTGSRSRTLDDGSFQVTLGGRLLVDGVHRNELAVVNNEIVWSASGLAAPVSGRAGALQDVVGDMIPRYQSSLDQVAATLVSDVNTLHQAGFDLAGAAGGAFFDPAGVTASSISLAAGLNAAGVAAGSQPATFDGENARLVAALSTSTSGADSRYESLLGGLGVETRAVMTRASASEVIAQAAADEIESYSGVSLDEEMVELQSAQRAFQASARVVSVVDEIFATLIERTGVVGR